MLDVGLGGCYTLTVAYLPLLVIGPITGVLAGMFGIGGGLIIVPALLFFVKMQELEAIGTSLAALIPPVGLLGGSSSTATDTSTCSSPR